MKSALAALMITFGTAVAHANPLTATVTTPPPPQTTGFNMGESHRPDGTALTLNSDSLRLNGQPWTPIDEHHAAGEFTVKLFGWSKERRFVGLRERIRETKAAVGRLLIDVPGYTFRVWVTNRSQGALELWRDYNGRACVEQRIEELKHDLAADGFCLQPFFATESAFLAVLFTFNLLSLYQHQTTPDAPYRQPGTLRVAVFLCGAVLGVMGRDVVVKLSAAWGGLRKHKPLVAATLDWLKHPSPKLIPPEDRLAIGGGMI